MENDEYQYDNESQYDIAPYLPEHYPEHQRHWAAPGVPLNPNLRDGFDTTPNDDRETLEIHHWWGLAYIVTVEWDKDGAGDDPDKAEWRQRWFEAWPSGVRYTVRVLDGGAWDRSTNRGSYPTLGQAVARAAEVGRAAFPLPEGADHYHYELNPRPRLQGGGWELKLYQNGQEVGGGVYPDQEGATGFNEFDEALDAASDWIRTRPVGGSI